jgi:hypothetical protein
MKTLKMIVAILLSVMLVATMGFPTALAAGQVSVVPQTYILFDVSGSTANSRETLTSLYKYLFTLFETSPYEMNLTICFFDVSLRNEDEIQTRVGGNNQGNTASQLYGKLLEPSMFSKSTAVYDSLVTFEEKFIMPMSDEEKKNTTIIVFSDMDNTVRTDINTHGTINNIFSKWLENQITVKGLIWQENGKKFVFNQEDEINKVYPIDLNNKIGAYECLFHVYFDILTGGYPKNYDFNSQQKPNVPVVVYPNSYEMFIITDNNQTTLKYVDSATGEYKDINATELFPAAQFSDNPPKILVITKQQIDLIGTTFLATSVSDFQVYPIVAPQVVDITVQQNGQSDLIRAKEITRFIVKYDPQIKIWIQNASELKAEITVTKDGDYQSTSFILDEQSDNSEFVGDKNPFPETGEYDVVAKIKDKNGASLSEYKISQYVTFANKNATNTGSDGDNGIGNMVLIALIIVAVLMIVAGGVFFLVKRKKKTPWNL